MKFILLLCVLGAWSCFADDGTVPSPGGQEHRYQIVTTTLPGLESSQDQQCLARLDTWTGTVWVLRVIPLKVEGAPPSFVHVWLPTQEMDSAIYKHALESMRAR